MIKAETADVFQILYNARKSQIDLIIFDRRSMNFIWSDLIEGGKFRQVWKRFDRRS